MQELITMEVMSTTFNILAIGLIQDFSVESIEMIRLSQSDLEVDRPKQQS